MFGGEDGRGQSLLGFSFLVHVLDPVSGTIFGSHLLGTVVGPVLGSSFGVQFLNKSGTQRCLFWGPVLGPFSGSISGVQN